jgi:ABC-type Co2+ transport system permease subunit
LTSERIISSEAKIQQQLINATEDNSDSKQVRRGCSFYEIEKGKIYKGIDVVEPAVFKTGGLSLTLRSIQSKITEEPIRLVPLALWFAYIYVVFLSDWFFGLPATALEQRTWEEARDFFFVSPILNLPFAPVLHPMLEGVFNLLLSLAALFVGFLSDDRRDKPNVLPMLPMVAGMQFLASAFLLP